MEILSVSLKNFKSHSDRHFTFQPGTNAISGENGAGKTSILEAIAWALFNHRGGYKIEDLIRNGAASAQVSVAFVSNRDQRTYEVSRCTRTGYTIYDPQLSEKLDYTRIEEDVMPWLRQQFGVSAGTDLADLFANTIGVPQGMFTADFLKSDRERKKTFDTILKVDEYRKAHDELLALSKYSEATVKELDAEIARHDEALAELDSLLEKRQVQHHAIEQAQTDLQRSQTERDALHAEQTQLSTVAVELQQLETQLERLTATLQVNANGIDRLNAELRQVEQAVAICTAHRDAYNTFREAEDTYKLLQQQSRVEQGLQQQKRQHEKLLSDRQTQLAALTVQLDQLSEAKTAIEHLEPLVQQQQQLEQAQQALTQQLQTCLSWQQALKVQEKQLGQLRSRQQQIAQEIHRIQALEVSVQRIPILEQQQQRYQQQLSRIAAAAEFETELRHLLGQVQTQGDRYGQQVTTVSATLRELQQSVPLWSQVLDAALATMQNGVDWQQSLQTLLQGILADLAEQTSASKLEQQLHAAQTELHRARQHQAE
ncbi:SMC family ATPase, partial [Leptolyngbya sp. FACHB-36]|uniref:AAA family ATPase n=1 Tax=Leptolyngbya sp. FACHB-36 TaxID=2692808 RepID=UPI0016819B12